VFSLICPLPFPYSFPHPYDVILLRFIAQGGHFSCHLERLVTE
jgi:hypothetical protein